MHRPLLQKWKMRHISNFLSALLVVAAMAVTVSHAADSGQTPDPELRAALVRSIETTPGFKDRFEAEVWLVDMSTRLKPFFEDQEDRLKLLRIVHREATRTNLPPELVLAVMEVESRFDRFAISRSGARGLMQIMPFWLDEIGNLPVYQKLVDEGRLGRNLFQMETNIWFGCSILKHYFDIEKGNISRALARYNGSLGKARYPRLVSAALRKRWHKQ